MRQVAVWIVGVVILASPVRAAERPDGKVLYDVWESVHLGGGKAGYVHTLTVERGQGDGKVFHTSLVLDLTLRRFQDTVRQHMEVTNDETPEGKVTAVSMSQLLGKGQEMRLQGVVDGNQLHVKVEGAYQIDKRIRWNPDALGMYRQQLLFKDRKVKPGDRFSYLSYEPQVNSIIRVQVTVHDEEEVEVAAGKGRRRLLRVEAVPDKIQDVQLPAMIAWLDKDLEVLRSDVDVPGLGKLVRFKTTKADALKQGSVASLPPVQQIIRLNRRISDPHDTRLVVYRITLKGDEDPRKAFVQDERQEVKNVHGRIFEVHVHAAAGPEPREGMGKVRNEFLKSNYFINCDDGRVKELSRTAVGRETDPWRKALRIERWVHANMKITNYSEAMATADHVAKTLEGDCTEYAMLAAAMCRAAGVPSRTAIGLVYFEDRGRPSMGFHMWTEVCLDGQWLPIDATLGRGHVGAAHLKVTDHSWYDTQSLAPLLPLIRVMGKVSIEIVRAE
jgi:hypothetical protein